MSQTQPAFLAIAVLGAVTVSAAPIRLRTRTVDPVAQPGAFIEQRSGISPSHLLLQFETRPGADLLAELSRRGIRVLRHVPENTVLAVSTGPWDLAGLPVVWSGPLRSADKVSPHIAVADSGYLVIFHPDVAPERCGELIDSAGLLRVPNPNLLPQQLLATGPEERVRELADRDEVAYVFPASPDLLAGSPVVACAGPLEDGETVAEYVKVGRGWPQVNGEVELKYVLSSLTARMPGSTIRTEVARALEEWAKYAKLRFTPGYDAAAARTIAIKFARGAHGDAYPFDGQGKVLAHTFYPAPPNSEPIAGDIHLDDDEGWSAGSGVDLYSVVLHEAGHALGLGHSDRPGSVMYPYYRLSTVLASDDIEGIRNLYGERQVAANPPATSPTPSNPTPANPTPAPTNPTPANPTQGADRTPPALRIVSPAFTVVLTSLPTITFRGTATDNSAVSAVKWSTSAGASGSATGTTAWTAPDIPLLTGNNTVTVKALDATGNSTWRAVTVVRR